MSLKLFRLLSGMLFFLLINTSFSSIVFGFNGKIIKEKLNADGEGYTVVSVWGTPREMGYAQGHLFGKEIDHIVKQFKRLIGSRYVLLSRLMGNTVWKPKAVEEEIDGIVAGVKSVVPNSSITSMDIKIFNTYGDWSYACRSHSTWGPFVSGKTKTLSTRRLDFTVRGNIKGIKHHILVARHPANGGVRWVNLGWPGLVIAVTAVNEYGTLVSLHDYRSKASVGHFMPRSVATRYVLTLVKGLPVSQHLDAAFKALQQEKILTGTFINYYVPEGLGGVFTCYSGKACHKKRVPQKEFYGGHVIMTTNRETDGKSAPSDDHFMNAYYAKGGVKTLADHYGLMGHQGMHLLSLAFRKRGDMTIWFEGRLSHSVTPTVKIEFADLFKKFSPQEPGTHQEPNTAQETPSNQEKTSQKLDGGDATPEHTTTTPEKKKMMDENNAEKSSSPEKQAKEGKTTPEQVSSGCNCQQNQMDSSIFFLSMMFLLFLLFFLRSKNRV